MSCNCDTYNCLPIAPQILQCGEDILTSLLADETSYIMSYEFNGRWFGETITTTVGSPIELPNVFNEQYTHTIKLYKADGTLLNDTCYSFDTAMLMSQGGSPIVPEGGGLSYTAITHSGDSDTIPFALGTPEIIMDGTQTYLSDKFTWDGATITMTNGVSFYDGQTIGIFYA